MHVYELKDFRIFAVTIAVIISFDSQSVPSLASWLLLTYPRTSESFPAIW